MKKYTWLIIVGLLVAAIAFYFLYWKPTHKTETKETTTETKEPAKKYTGLNVTDPVVKTPKIGDIAFAANDSTISGLTTPGEQIKVKKGEKIGTITEVREPYDGIFVYTIKMINGSLAAAEKSRIYVK